MSANHDNFGHKRIPRKDFLKLIGTGSLFVGLGTLDIPNVVKNIKGVSATTLSIKMGEQRICILISQP
jgi:hypothetical protein